MKHLKFFSLRMGYATHTPPIRLKMRSVLLLFALLLGSLNVWATDYEYQMVTSVNDISAGTYVVGALRSTSATNNFYFGKASVSSGDWEVSADYITIAESNGIRKFDATSLPTGAVEFTFTGDNTNGFTISNSTNYLYYTAASNRKLAFASTGSTYKWTVSAKSSPLISGGIVLKRKSGGSASSYTISENSTAVGAIRGYSSTTEYRAIYLFKKQEKSGSSDPTVCAEPTFSPAAGTFYGSQEIAITTSTDGASVYYTTDNSTPSSSNGTLYSAPFSITETTTIKAIAVKDDYEDSEVASAVYTKGESVTSYDIDFETNVKAAYINWIFTNAEIAKNGDNANISAHGGTHYGTTGGKATASVQTSEKFATPGVFTCYVSKQSNNTTSSTWYIQVSSDGETWTEAASQSATSMNTGTWVEFSADLSSYSNVYVRLYYDGSTAVRNIDDISLTTASAVAKPTISGDENFLTSTTVTITHADADHIYYTTNGDAPTTSSAEYTAPFTVSADGTTTVKAIAVKGSDESAVAEQTFTKITTINVADAIAAIPNQDDAVADQYVSGIVCTAGTSINGSGQMTYYISDDGTETTRLQVYLGKNLNNTAFTATSDLAIGDRVVVFGQLKNFKGTKEMNSGNYLVWKEAAAVAAPVFSPDGGGFMGETDVTITCATASSTIYYTTDGTTPTKSSTPYTAAVHLDATTTITAVAYVGDDASLVIAKTFTLTAPMTVAAALTALDSEDPINNAAVVGIISTAPTSNPNSGRLTYYISDDGTTTDELEVYLGYGLNGASFSNKTDLQVGDEVTVFGNLTIFNSTTKEFSAGSRLLAFNRPTVAVTGVTLPATANVKVGKTITLSPTIEPSNATNKNVSWEVTSGGSYASVDAEGVVTGNAVGTATIQVTTADGGFTATCEVTVADAPTFNDPTYEWQLVTSDAQLVAGKYYVIASSSKDKTATSTITSGYTGEASSTVADGAIAYDALGANTAVFQLGGVAETWTLNEVVEQDKLLGGATTANLTWGTGTTTWPITIDANSNAIIGASDGYRILHNVNSNRFKLYNSATSTSMLLPQLYVWAEKVYKLRYDANGGENAPAAQPAVAGEATVTSSVPTAPTGKVFDKWTDDAEGEGTVYAVGDVVDLSSADVTLYAQWRDPATYTVSYDANGGSGVMDDDAEQTEGSQYTIKDNAFTRAGYLFTGWKAYDASEAELTITSGKITIPASNVTIKAQWQSATDSKWVLVESLSQLADGDKVIIAAKDSKYALGAEAGSTNKYRAPEAANKAGKLLIPTAGATQLTLGKSGDYYTFKDGDNYLMWSSGNTLPTEISVSDNSRWTISFEEGVMHIVNKTDENRQIQYNDNSGQERFATYTGSQKAVVLYKYLDMDPEDPTSGHERVDLVLSGIGTICLPYDVKASDRFGGVFYMPSHKTSGFANFIEETGTLRAGKAYIFVAENEFIRLKYSGDAVSEPLSNVADTRGLIGTFTNIAPGYLTHKYVIANNKLMECGSGAYLNAYRAYLDLDAMPEEALVINDGPSAAPRRRLGVGGNAPQVATGVDQVPSDQVPNTKVLINGQLYIMYNGTMYNVQGQLVK